MDQVKPTLIKPKQWPGSPLPHCIIQSSRSYHKGIELRRARLELRLTLPYTQMNRAGFTVSGSWIHLTHNPEKKKYTKISYIFNLGLNESCLNGWMSPPHNFCTKRSTFTQSPWSGLQSITFLDWLQSEEPKHWKSTPVLLSDQYATLPLSPLISSWSQCSFCFGSLIALAHTFH